ncbi:uncharacterized protein [Hetaerina americana]|uniref:uncharacterized protein n=1 Tax=Hetaerina americana TaxID=62018 RepID=UPI003A7F324B
MVGAFGGPILRGPHTVGPFFVDPGRRGSLSTTSGGNSPTPQQLSGKQGTILLSSSQRAQVAGGGGCGFPGTITFWKERQRGGLSSTSRPMGRGSHQRRNNEELLHYNRTGAGLSCRLWHHWQRQQEPRYGPKEHETHLDLVHPEDGEGSTVLHLAPLEGEQPLASCFRKASPEEAAEDLDARGEPRYKYEGWGMGGEGGRQQQLRIIAASLRIVYREDDDGAGSIRNPRRGSSRLWGEEALLLRQDDEDSAVPFHTLSAESVSREFAHLAPLVRSTLECVSVVPPHSLPLLPPPRQHTPLVVDDNPKRSASRLASAFLLSAVGFFLLLITTFYIAYFL